MNFNRLVSEFSSATRWVYLDSDPSASLALLCHESSSTPEGEKHSEPSRQVAFSTHTPYA